MTLAHIFLDLWYAWIATEVLLVVLTRTSRGSGNTRDRGSLLILWPVIFGSIWLALNLAAARPHSPALTAPWVAMVSVVVFAAGLLIRWTAIVALGTSFSINVAIHANQTVRRTGLYRFVRHPSYTGMLLIFLALGLHARNWISLAILLTAPTAALLYRIHVEEEALTEAFGEEYRSYSAVTKRLIPGLY